MDAKLRKVFEALIAGDIEIKNQKYLGLRNRVFIARPSATAGGAPLLVAGQRDCTEDISVGDIDTSSKDDLSGFHTRIAGLRDWNISMSGAHVLGDTALGQIRSSLLEGDHAPETGQFVVFIEYEDGSIYTGNALCTSYSVASPASDLTTYDLTFAANGPLAPIQALPQMALFADAYKAFAQMQQKLGVVDL